MDAHKEKTIKRKRKHARIRARVSGTLKKPRLSVFVSNRSVFVQLIDDDNRKTIAASTSQKMKGKTLTEKAREVGKDIAHRAKESKIEKVVFDRGGFLYSGKVKAVAEGAREEGLVF
jgi:large subunit ribosomal protein L18